MQIADMHCDTIERLLRCQRQGVDQGLRENDGHVDLLRMKAGGYCLQNFALFVNAGTCEDPWEEVCLLYRLYREEMERNSDLIAPALGVEDIAANAASGKMSALLAVEEGAVCKGDLAKLRRLYEMGVRMMTLTWNYQNELGSPSHYCTMGKKVRPDVPEGLTECGREFVTEMEELGMIVDVSHLSDAGFYDVLQTAQKPFVASHSNARAICPAARNLSDDMIRKLAEKGGVMGLNFYADFLESVPAGKPNPGSLESIVNHARHITDVGGMEVLGLGSDFDGIDTNEAIPHAGRMKDLWESLHRAGYTESQLDRIFYGNVLRVYQETLG
ncbi:MAG: dipeptidase [Lachnospiraceae bacterium]|nr:dipeptidase [Lachnospiraceae bacterium]